jgi:hypothetical protein
MRYLIILVIVLTSCEIQTRVAENKDSIHPEIANKADAVQVANKENAVHVEKEAVHVEKDALHVEKDALHVEKDAVGHIEKGAVNVEQGAVSLQGTVQSGAVQLPVNVQTGAIQMPLTANVADGAVKLNLELKIEPGAIVVRGVEQGAIQTQIETPWWAYVIMAVLGVGWLITKFRKHTRSKEISSVWDVFF